MLMCMAAVWCLPVKGADVTSNGYSIYGQLAGDNYHPTWTTGGGSNCTIFIQDGTLPDGELEALTDPYILFKLDNPAQVGKFQMTVDGGSLDSEGKLWIKPTESYPQNWRFEYDYEITDRIIGEVFSYTISFYRSQDESQEPLVIFTGNQRIVDMAEIRFTPQRATGDIGTVIPVTLSFDPKGMSFLQNVEIRIEQPEGITLSCDEGSLKRIDDWNTAWILPIDPAQGKKNYSLTVTASDSTKQYLSARLYTTDGTQILYCDASLMVSIPSDFSQKDIDGLQKIATDNNNTYLSDYIANKGYLQDNNDSIYLQWDENISPARINNLNLHFNSLTTLDVSAFDSLEYLIVNNASITSLDVSMLKRLKEIRLHSTDIINLDDVELPDNPGLVVAGRVDLPLGEQVSEYEYRLISGTPVNLSAYATMNGEQANFVWKKRVEGRETVVEWEQTTPGIFTVPNPDEADEGKYVRYWCEISSSKYPEWEIRTYDIQLMRGAIDYSEDDIQLLKNLAAANPDCHELQQFVADSVKGWEEKWEDYYGNDRNRKVAVDWNYATPARISKLRIRNMGTVKNLDLSGFTELTYIDVCDLTQWMDGANVGLETLDLTKNTKLRYLEANGNWSLKVLKLSGLAALEEVYVRDCSKLESLDLSASKSTLKGLNIGFCDKLTVNLAELSALEYCDISSTTQYADYIANLPQSIQRLECNYTNYPLLDFAKYPNLKSYGIPQDVETLDISQTKLESVTMNGSKVRYSTFTPNQYTEQYSCQGGSQITIPDLKESAESQKETIYDIAVGDTVDLSTEAEINGVQSKYIWVDEYDRTESTGVFIPVPDEPGKFVYNGGGRPGVYYFCIISNEKYCEYSEINQWSGWRLVTFPIKLPEIKAGYAQAEVAALKAIVDNTDSPDLKHWWESEAWKSNEQQNQGGRFQVWWMLNEETHVYHVEALQLIGLGDTLTTLDVSAFKEMISLNCDQSGLSELSVKDNNKLQDLQINSSPELTTLILPDEKTNLRTLYCLYNNGLETLNVADYTNLRTLNLRSCESLTSGDLSRLTNLEELWLNYTKLEPVEVANNNYPNLRILGVPRMTKSIDISNMQSLIKLDVNGSLLKFSTLTIGEGQTCSVEGQTNWVDIPGLALAPESSEPEPYYLFPTGGTFNIGSEMRVDGVMTEIYLDNDNIKIVDKAGDMQSYTLEGGKLHDEVDLWLINDRYPMWELNLHGMIISCDGDANLDTKVDVRDVPVTVNHITQSEDALPYDRFGFYEADLNNDNNVDVADLQGIINLILKPQTKGANILADGYIPTVELSAENGYLYMDAEVPVASLQLELTGMTQAEPLLGKAAALTQASTVGDTTRIIGYSLKNVTIPAGKSVLMKFPEGARLAKAVFADEKARSLEVRTKGDIATSNETIRVTGSHEVANYPNPFRTTTTLAYTLDTEADAVELQVYNFNGAQVDIVQGLGTQAGENRCTYTTHLGSGMYVYRLAISRQGTIRYSKSNTFIIK